jgi:hypothetical protein
MKMGQQPGVNEGALAAPGLPYEHNQVAFAEPYEKGLALSFPSEEKLAFFRSEGTKAGKWVGLALSHY